MARRAAIDSLKNKNTQAQRQLEEATQDNEARNRMAGESPAYQSSIKNETLPKLNSLLKKIEKPHLNIFPLLIGIIVVAGTAVYLSSRKSLHRTLS